jgi:hypothetical protein
LLSSAGFAQTQRGALPVLGLRAPDGENEAASVATASLRRSATQAGFQVPDNTPALEQLIAAFGCDDSVPVDCLRQIANQIGSPRFMYGSVRRAGPRRATAPVRMEVMVFDASAPAPSAPQQVELPRAQAVDVDRWRQATDQVVRTLLPPPAPAISNTPSAGGSGSQGAGREVPGPIAPPQPGPPIRRYIGFGAIGAGAIVGVVGGVLGGTGFSGVASEITATPAGQNAMAFNRLFASNGMGGPVSDGNALCAALANPSAELYIDTGNSYDRVTNRADTNVNMTIANANTLCARASGALTTMGVMVGIGAALVVTGVVLVVTDSGSPAPSAQPTRETTPATAAAARSLSNSRPTWAFAPSLGLGVHGGTFALRF